MISRCSSAPVRLSELRVTSHVENLAQSACKRASGDKMWCGSCHDPHTPPDPAEKVAYFRSKCLSCHQTQDCRAAKEARLANGDSCTQCHMPRGPANDIQHVVFTDHSIRRKPAGPGAAPASDSAAELVPYSSYTATTRDLALAYAVVALRDHNTADRERAFPLLKQAADQGIADATALAYLAEFYRDAKDDAHALPIYQQVWRMDKSQYAAAAALGAYQMQRGNVAEAIQLWREALTLNPAIDSGASKPLLSLYSAREIRARRGNCVGTSLTLQPHVGRSESPVRPNPRERIAKEARFENPS